MLNEFKSIQIVRKFFSAIFILTVVASIGMAQPGERLSAAAKSDFAKGEFNSCIKEYSALIAAEPKNDGFYGERSRCYFLKGKNLTKSGKATAESDTEINSALADAEKALVLNPKNTAALNVRGLVKNYRKDEQGAIADFSRVIEIDPKSPKAYLNRAVSKSALKDFEGAIADYTKVIAINPQFAAAYLDRGRIYSESGKKTEAITDFTKAIELEPKSAKGYIYRGRDYGLLNKRVEAIADYSKAIELNPKAGYAFMNRGNLYYFQKDYDKALPDLQEAVRLEVDDACVKVYRGRIYMEKGVSDWAYWAYKDFISPGCVHADFYRAALNFKNGDYAGAISGYNDALYTYKNNNIDTAPILAAIERTKKAQQVALSKDAAPSNAANSVVTSPPTGSTNSAPSSNSNVSQPAGEILNMTTDEWIELFKQGAILKGQTIVAEGTADKLLPYKKNIFNQLSVDAMNKHFVLLVFTDDPTYDSFFFIDGEIIINPFFEKGYYVSAPKITKLLNNQYINAVTLGSNNITRKISVEFRADKPGKVRYILFVVKDEQYDASTAVTPPSTGSTNCVSGNCVNGFGKYHSPDGDIYEGDFVNGKGEGQGTNTFKNGNVYTGQFSNGLRNGKGTSKTADGNIYEGDFVNNKFEGQGTYTFKNGNVYTGQFADNKRNGKGKMIYSTGEIYDGNWVDDKRNGKGKSTFPSGDIYEGDFVNDNREGQGTYTFKNGNYYTGEWKNFKPNGYGKEYIKATNAVREGTWKDGVFVGKQ